MIARKLGLPLIVGSMVLYGCDMLGGAEGGDEASAIEGAEEMGGAGEGAEDNTDDVADGDGAGSAEEAGPDKACAALIEAIKGGDNDAIKAASTEPMAAMLEDEAGKKAMVETLAEATCGEAKVNEDGATAIVPVTAGEQNRDIPFAKVDGTWKFDAAKYVEMYPPAEKGAKAKKKKGKKKKGKRKKK